MKIDFVGRHVALDERLRKHATEKLTKALRLLHEPLETHVTLEAERHRNIAEIRVHHRRGALHAREESVDPAEAVTLAAEHLARQARRLRKRAVDRRRRAGRFEPALRHWPTEAQTRESALPLGHRPRIIRTTQLELKPMTLDEATLALASSRNEFVVFVDADSERVSVLYKRRDDNYGLIAPET